MKGAGLVVEKQVFARRTLGPILFRIMRHCHLSPCARRCRNPPGGAQRPGNGEHRHQPTRPDGSPRFGRCEPFGARRRQCGDYLRRPEQELFTEPITWAGIIALPGEEARLASIPGPGRAAPNPDRSKSADGPWWSWSPLHLTGELTAFARLIPDDPDGQLRTALPNTSDGEFSGDAYQPTRDDPRLPG